MYRFVAYGYKQVLILKVGLVTVDDFNDLIRADSPGSRFAKQLPVEITNDQLLEHLK